MKKSKFWTSAWQKLKKDRLAMTGLVVICVLFAVAAAAPGIASNKPYIYITADRTFFPLFKSYPELKDINFRNDARARFKLMPPVPYSPSEYNLNEILEPPSARHILGTDDQGRDLASRMVHGTTVSILIGFIAVFIYITIGIIIGALAGYYGGIVDIIVSRIIEIVMCFPTLFLILTVIALIGTNPYVRVIDKSGLISIMIVIGITGWTGIARIVRGEFLKLREQDFVTASRSIGVRDPGIIFRHILPNSLAPVFVTATFGIASTILIESSLSFLGFGVKPPTPSWGEILSQSRTYIDFAWWLTLIPGMAIFITITAYNLLGEGLRDVLDPKSVHRQQ